MKNEDLLKAYKGEEKYLFVSYAHKDRSIVLPAIKQLAADGYRVWYDEGIEVGDDWAEKIGTSLENAALILFFASKDSVKSQNCLRELTFAKEHDIPVLTVQCGTFDMPEELSRQLMTNQAAQITNYDTYGSLVKGLKPVLDRHEVGGGITVEIQDEKISFRQSGGGRKTGKIVVAILIVLCIIGFAAFRIFFGNVPSVVGSQTSDAQNAIKDAGFEPTVSYNYSDEYEYGIVFEQSSEGRTLKAVPVVIKQSIGPEEDLTDVPDTVGSHISDGARMLIDAGLTKFRIIPKQSEKFETAYIADQSIPAGLRVSRSNLVSLDVATDGSEIEFEINGVKMILGKDELLIDSDEIAPEPEDEQGLTAAERAIYDSIPLSYYADEFKKPVPITDPTLLDVLYSERSPVCYLARDMVIDHQPTWMQGRGQLMMFIAPGATVTLTGDDWARLQRESIVFTVMEGGTLIIDCELPVQYPVNHGTLIVNGRMYYQQAQDQWGYGGYGILANDGDLIVNGSVDLQKYFVFAGSTQQGSVTAKDRYEYDIKAPFTSGSNGRGGFVEFINKELGTEHL